MKCIIPKKYHIVILEQPKDIGNSIRSPGDSIIGMLVENLVPLVGKSVRQYSTTHKDRSAFFVGCTSLLFPLPFKPRHWLPYRTRLYTLPLFAKASMPRELGTRHVYLFVFCPWYGIGNARSEIEGFEDQPPVSRWNPGNPPVLPCTTPVLEQSIACGLYSSDAAVSFQPPANG